MNKLPPNFEITVDASTLTAHEKEKVQKAYFALGLEWRLGGSTTYKDADSYTNATSAHNLRDKLMINAAGNKPTHTYEELMELAFTPKIKPSHTVSIEISYEELARAYFILGKYSGVTSVPTIWGHAKNILDPEGEIYDRNHRIIAEAGTSYETYRKNWEAQIFSDTEEIKTLTKQADKLKEIAANLIAQAADITKQIEELKNE